MFKKIFLGFLALVLIIAIGGFAYYRLVIYQPLAISESDRAAISLMPLPAKLELQNGSINISLGLHVNFQNFKNDKIEKSANRLFTRLENRFNNDFATKRGVVLNINCLADSPDKIQQVVEDESYTMQIDKKGIQLDAPTPYGIIRGLETVFQLCEKEGDKIVLPYVEISDNPRFAWRGVMLDVCRHWVPKDVVLRILDAMAMVKMNVFHWHLSEDQGFRVECKTYPKLHEIGSNGKYYTQNEIKEVIQYAAERGIRVIPEFDLPGHSKSWQIAYPELSCVDFPLEFGSKKGMAFAPPIDPTREEVYTFLDEFLCEMTALFPDPYFHIGGDEVNPKYWNESLSIQKFMIENGMKDHHDLQAYFNKRMNAILKKHRKFMLGWNEILHPELGKDIIVQSWSSHKSLFEAVQNGGTAILSAGYYLDFVLPAKEHYKVDPLVLEGAVDITPDTAFWKMYNMAIDFAGTEMKSELVIFDRDPNNVFGFFAMMENRMAFKNGVIKDNQLICKFDGPVGVMDFEANFISDSVGGEISFGLLNFKSHGKVSGGSEMMGTEMPKIEVIKPLTLEEKARIIGGEACQWAEFVDGNNIESRVWPRSVAIAEKLWSPHELTSDVDDMYRRMDIVSKRLTEQGSTHSTQYEEKLRMLVSVDGFETLKILTDVLEEVKYHGRMPALLTMENVNLPEFALDRIVDAVRPESMSARDFNKLVDVFIENEEDEELKTQIIAQLEIWKENHDKLEPFILINEKLKDIENISAELELVSEAALSRLQGFNKDFNKDEISEKLVFLETGEAGVILAVVPGLRKLVANN